ncbi:GMC oxidoreductase [Colletotrichum navitas]|uniref:GMC oxidoreductase n=1 Tax=Colletotrichum navitas TaxID=681940 RepID=A0AAD8V3K0_9PEZI|nr:GMC oxidoreductase [Colletotrichum navitas]KAK1584980.1 GMC oxidoreductase [Colletotrichum navitas]
MLRLDDNVRRCAYSVSKLTSSLSLEHGKTGNDGGFKKAELQRIFRARTLFAVSFMHAPHEDDDVRVLVVEAGADKSADPLVLTPGLVAGLYGKEEYDWNFTSVPQGILDTWAALGNEGWDFDTLAPYFRKFGTDHPPPQSAKDAVGLAYHDAKLNGKGPVHVSYGEGYNTMNAAWMRTFDELGLGMTGDPRSGKAFGAFQNPCSIDPETKTRSFSATAYYTPEVANRPNLVVLTETLVKKVNFSNSDGDVSATGVQIVTRDGQEKTVSARVEVVLSAGTFHTAQLLELSGVGRRELLESHGIPVVIDNPNVGENVQDHPIVCQSFEVNDGVPSGDVLRDGNVLNTVVGQYQATREGPMGQSTISSAYLPVADHNGLLSKDEKRSIFDAHETQSSSSTSEKLIRSLIESSDEPSSQYLLFPSQITINDHPANVAEYVIPTRPENYITIMTILNHPFSRGTVHITSPDVAVLPEWDPKFNSNPLDLELLARNVQFVEKIVGTEPFSSLLKPGGKRLPDLKGDDLEDAKEIVRQRQISVFHVSGSCAMLPRGKGGVVDERLRVHGVRNVRVVDASIFPVEPLGNIQSTVYAVAERAADMIKEDRRAGEEPSWAP